MKAKVKCSKCGKSFKDGRGLASHKRTCSGKTKKRIITPKHRQQETIIQTLLPVQINITKGLQLGVIQFVPEEQQ